MVAAAVIAHVGIAGAVIAASPASAATPPASTAEQQATAQAKSSGTPVLVPADNTEYSQTVANPDGSFTQTSDLQPQRVHRDTGWVPVDASLRANADGTLSPAASVQSLTLSGGGTGPLARFDDGAGHVLAVSMPMPIPAPVISGAVATYPAVLPGIDLRVTATTEGGIREVLVVQNAQAAANPALASLKLSTTTTKLTIATDARGAIVANDASTGTPVFTAPPAAMWDSTGPGTAAARSLAATASSTAADDDGDRATSDADGPGQSAHVTAIPVAVSGNAITLTPPAVALTGTNVTYPAYIDPSLSGSLQKYAYVESNHASTTHYKPSDNLRVGYDDWTTNCGSPCYINDVTRTFLEFNGVAGMDGAADVTSAILGLTQVSSSCSGSYKINTAITSADTEFSSSLNWSNQPGRSTLQDSMTMDGTNTGRQFKIPTIADHMASANYDHVVLAIWADNESDHCTYRHFGVNPTLSVTYFHYPNTPTALKEINGGASINCNTTSPGSWVPKASSNQVTLSAAVSTKDAATALIPHLYLSTNGGSYADNTLSAVTPPSGGSSTVSKVFTLADGSSYRWYAKTVVSADTSVVSPTAPSGAPSTSACYFRYDATSPTNPTFTSADFPPAGPTTVSPGGSGTITVTSADGGTNPSGLAKVNYDINGTGIASGGVQGSATASGNSAAVTISTSQLHWGTNTLWAQGVDNAGNLSAALAYNFYVQQGAFGPYTPGTAGDIDGDNQPDLITVDAAGNIRLFSDPEDHSIDPGTPAADPRQYGGTILIDHATANSLWPNASYAGALVAHAGSFHGLNVDDLVVQHGNLLAVLENPGGAGVWSPFAVAKPATCAAGCGAYNGVDWSNVTQMIAVPTSPGQAPDLLTVEDYNGTSTLYLYTPKNGPPGFNPPTMINASNGTVWSWHDQQLIAAGKLPGSTGTTLWARDLTTGALYTIPGILSPISGTPARVTRAANGYDPATYPAISTVGQPDPQGNLQLWAATTTKNLAVIRTSTPTSTTSFDTPATVNTVAGWAGHEIALGSTYTPYNHNAVADTTGSFQSMDGTYSFSNNALTNATMTNGANVMTNIPFGSPNCRTWTMDCPADLDDDPSGALGIPAISGVHGGYQIVTATGDQFSLAPSWAHQPDNYAAAGQVLPAPICPNGAGSFISFLGAGFLAQTITATITYTDGNTQQITVTVADWANDNPTGGTPVLTATNRVKASDGTTTETTNTHLTATDDIQLLDNGQTLAAAGAQIASITLPTNSAAHIFAISVR